MQKYSSSNEHNKLARKLALYLPLGYPNWEMFYRVLQEIEGHGIGCLEIGLPVSNPFMDGETIKKTHEQTLPMLNTDIVKEELSKVRKIFSSRIVLMTYAEGLENFKVKELPYWIYDAVLCVDGVQSRNDYSGIVRIFSESMSDLEMEQAINESTHFAYVVSAAGKTGGDLSSQHAYIETIKRLRKFSDLPAFVGFGIKDNKGIEEVLSNGADGAVIGSEFIRQIDEDGITKVKQYLSKLTI
ncbi:tryptophan synthase subunit alpha [Lancefieldella parvula]|uniref:tryptophan synthase subunit alpha n=1 Tax=Lancefieldella parvula TaxID=1382 RepID=UPI0028D38308|nr:tryptophan synthase subunit alpha [Lancefieldella parvula]